MDVKSAFLNGLIQEEVYVEQPPGFEDFEKSDHVFKIHKALYGLKQAPKAWYERLSKFLVEKVYDRGNIDTTMFIKRYLNDLIIVQIYVDDTVFGATNEALCKNFAKEMQGEFEMSIMGELRYFHSLQIKQSEEEIFINQERYTQDMLKKFDMLKLKSISTPMSPSTKLDLDGKGKDVDQKLYRGVEGSAKLVEKSAPHVESSSFQAKGSTYKSVNFVLQTEDSPQGVDKPTKTSSIEPQNKNDSEQGIEVVGSETKKQQTSPPNSEEVSIMDIFYQMVKERQAEKDTAKTETQNDGEDVGKGKKFGSATKVKAKAEKAEATAASPIEAKSLTKGRKTMATKTAFFKRRKSSRLPKKSR
ncbi:Reverse transcriptase [Theobroma cacao]|nr:Reverse transcriptase [Theobroma cacao]